MPHVKVTANKCRHCKHIWYSPGAKRCANCKRYTWDRANMKMGRKPKAKAKRKVAL